MKLFLDSGNISEIEKWHPVIRGVTTNSSIIERDKPDLRELTLAAFPYSVSMECQYWKILADKYPNGITDGDRNVIDIKAKVPLITPEGKLNIEEIQWCLDGEIKINCTALMSVAQVAIACQLGVRYVSLFWGRIEDEGGNAFQVVQDSMSFVEDAKHCSLIVGSVRTVKNVMDAFRAGADIVTVPPKILEKMLDHKYSRWTVNEFEEASRRISG